MEKKTYIIEIEVDAKTYKKLEEKTSSTFTMQKLFNIIISKYLGQF